jgi:hypothetical protein
LWETGAFLICGQKALKINAQFSKCCPSLDFDSTKTPMTEI